MAYTRDSKGRVVQVSTRASASDPSWSTLASSIGYEPWGSVTGAQYGNGLAMSQVWTAGRLASKRLFNSSTGANLSSLAYSYDPNDNIGSIVDQLDGARSAHYGYDVNDRLAFASMTVGAPATGTESYGYTAGTNRLTSISTGESVKTTVYDARGNMLSSFRPGVAVAAGYDGHGRLVSYTRSDQPDRANAYNGLDERVKVTTSDGWDTTVRHYVYDLDHRLIGEYGATGAAIAETIWLQPEVANDNQPIGGDDGIGGYAPLAVATGSGAGAALYWVHGNHLGVPRVTTDASGAPAMPSGITVPGYPGQQRTLPDLYYNRHRDYDSSTGRYIQADPIGLEGGNNPYLYAEGNPLRFIDPNGQNPLAIGIIGARLYCSRFPLKCAAAAAAVVGALHHAINGPIPAIPQSEAGTESSEDCDDDDDCEAQHEIDRATCRSAWRFVAQDGLVVCYRTAFARYSECRTQGGPKTPLGLPPRNRKGWNY